MFINAELLFKVYITAFFYPLLTITILVVDSGRVCQKATIVKTRRAPMRFILFYFKQQPLQVFPFWVVDAYGVVHGVWQLAHYAHLPMGVGGSGKAHGLEVVATHGL